MMVNKNCELWGLNSSSETLAVRCQQSEYDRDFPMRGTMLNKRFESPSVHILRAGIIATRRLLPKNTQHKSKDVVHIITYSTSTCLSHNRRLEARQTTPSIIHLYAINGRIVSDIHQSKIKCSSNDGCTPTKRCPGGKEKDMQNMKRMTNIFCPEIGEEFAQKEDTKTCIHEGCTKSN